MDRRLKARKYANSLPVCDLKFVLQTQNPGSLLDMSPALRIAPDTGAGLLLDLNKLGEFRRDFIRVSLPCQPGGRRIAP